MFKKRLVKLSAHLEINFLKQINQEATRATVFNKRSFFILYYILCHTKCIKHNGKFIFQLKQKYFLKR